MKILIVSLFSACFYSCTVSQTKIPSELSSTIWKEIVENSNQYFRPCKEDKMEIHFKDGRIRHEIMEPQTDLVKSVKSKEKGYLITLEFGYYDIQWLNNEKSISRWQFYHSDNQKGFEVYLIDKNKYTSLNKENCKTKRQSLENQIISSIILDLNLDGLKDKILIIENRGEEDIFNKSHFGLPIKLQKKTGEEYVNWLFNDNLIFSTNNSCVSEGFDRVVHKDSFFTIELQTCYDLILVQSYITFRIFKDKILLHKYGEEYFDKSDHSRKMPSKIWNSDDFGEINFEDVTEEFLFNLRS